MTNNIRIHSGDKLNKCLELDKDFVHNDIMSIHTLIKHCRKKDKCKKNNSVTGITDASKLKRFHFWS